ncbi:MAG TPA: chemotaxis protein CheD, partial [Thermoanaerobaculia bacterium]|nr:chemotaxis protein CheD [Thermoanaerobaculia bacterium]
VAAGGDAARFGTTAVRDLIEQLRRRGAVRLTAKIFGGSSMHSALAAAGRDLGTQNVHIAEEILEAERIPVVAADTGGQAGRKLLFHTDDGTAFVRYLEARS